MVLTYRNKFNKKYGFSKDESHSLEDISKITGYKLSGLQVIFNKGIGAYIGNRKSVRPSVTSPEQWAQARVYSAVMGGKAARIDASHLIPKKGFHFMPDGTIMADKLHSENKLSFY